jgi:hypothetical protein
MAAFFMQSPQMLPKNIALYLLHTDPFSGNIYTPFSQ